MIKPTDLEAVQKLCDAATPGPWKDPSDPVVRWDDPKSCGYDSREHHRGAPYYCTGPRTQSILDAEADAAFIASARTLVPQMAEEIRELRAELVAERARTDALVASLLRCGFCGDVATKAFTQSAARYCDDCGGRTPPDYPYAEPLRAIAHARRLAAGGEEK